MDVTVHTGECRHKNAYLLQNTTLLLTLPMLHPSSAWSGEERFPPKGDRDSRWEPRPRPKAPSSLSLLRGGVVAAWLLSRC